MSADVAVAGVRRPGRFVQAIARNRLSWFGILLLGAIVLMAILAPVLAPHDPFEQDLVARLDAPSAEHWLGTDSYGRDVLSRLIYGARISLAVSFAAVAIAMLVGTAIGVVSGYVGGLLDQIVMSVLDVMLAFPTLLMGLMIAAMLGPSLQNLVIAIAVTEVAPFARVARAPTITLKRRDFIEASRSYGAGPLRIMVRHILPNMLSDVVVVSSLWLASAIRTEASLSFIGLGAPPPAPSWGSMIRDGFENILDAWWLAVFPSLAILATVLALNLLGDALRDATDPRAAGSR